MQRERRDVAASLRRKGFREATHGDHVRYWLFVGDKRQAIYTKISHGTSHRTIQENLLKLMAYQLKLTKAECLELVDCQMDGDAYLRRLRANGVQLDG